MGQTTHYVIRGGIEGRDRLRILGRVMHPYTTALLDRLGVGDGLRCLDVGCGGGDVTLELARRVGPRGRVVGVDMDETKLDLARRDAAAERLDHVDFRTLDVRGADAGGEFDIVYSRFLLTHLEDPGGIIDGFKRHLCPGGLIVIEDVDFTGYFTYPASRAFTRYLELYYAVVNRRGGDPDIGSRLPVLLIDAGLADVDMCVVQPAGTRGEMKLLNPLTMENIAEAVLQDGLASRQEVDAVVQELYDFAADPRTIAGLPRIVQAWGRVAPD